MADELWIPGKTGMFFIGGALGTAIAVAIGFMALMSLDESATAEPPQFVTSTTAPPTSVAAVGTLTIVESVDSTLTLIGTEFAYDPRGATVEGAFELELVNEGRVIHNLEFEGITDFVIEAGPGQSDSAKIRLDPATYVIFCSIAGHREAGMEGTITVEG